MRLKGQSWTLIGLLLMLAAAPVAVRAQVALTTVQDTIYNADGTAAQGSVVVSWSAFTTAAGNMVAAGTTAATLGAGGALSMSLAPNAGATPTGSYYTAVFHLSDGTTSTQYWVIPVAAAGGAAVKVSAIQNQVLPTSVAMQTVSKAYVDTAIANAVSGNSAAVTGGSSPYVLTTGSTMTGPLVLPGDPVSPPQAADKSYVDTNVAQVASGMGTKVSLLPSATQTISQPAGTQLEVNSLNGVLDATGFLSGGGNNGFANALTSTLCSNGCEVRGSQAYPGSENIPVAQIPSGAHVIDDRGGAVNHYFDDPLGANAGGYIGSSWQQVTNVNSQQFAASHPGTAGEGAYLMQLTHDATAGGSNLLPGSREPVPYGKSTYGVLGLTGNYNTQGQHVQFNNFVNCYSVGDCLAGGQFIVSAGGYRDEADEGTHPFDLQVEEDTHVFQGTCVSGCTAGSTSLTLNPTSSPGTQGDGRFLIDKNPADVISTGYISGSGLNLFSIVDFTGTNFPVSQFVQLAQQENSQPENMAPGLVTVPILTSGVGSGVATTTAALPASGVACVADIVSTGVFPNFETATYSVVDATHLQLNLQKVHYPGALVSVGGLCGYGIEETVDTTMGIRQVFPVVGSISPTAIYYAGANSGVVGYTGSTGGYLNQTVQIASAVRNGNTVTLTTAANMAYDFTGLTFTVSGVADSSFNGSFVVTASGGNTLTYANTGPNGSSSGGTASIITGGYNLYPMAEVLSVANPATKAIDGTMMLAPNTVAWASGDALEEPHYHQQLVAADTEVVTQFLPRPAQDSSAGKTYQGLVGPGMRGWQVNNAAPASEYLGAGGTHLLPDDAFLASGPWRNSFEADAGTEAVMRVHCNLHGCARWDAGYALFSLDSQVGQDFLFYYPNANAASWMLGGAVYNFSPSAFTAANINVTKLNASTVSTSTLNATAGTISGLSAFSLGTANTAGAFTWQPGGTHQNGNSDPWFGISDGANYVGLAVSLPAPAGTKVVGGYFSGLGVGGATANTNTPIFGVLNSAESGEGLGSVAFTITDSNGVQTFRNTLDDGSGNAVVAGKLTASAGLRSGNAGNTDLVGTLVIAAGATSSASYSFSGGYATAPVCMVQPQNATPAVAQALNGYVAQVSAGTLSVNVGAAPGVGVTFGYTCVARN